DQLTTQDQGLGGGMGAHDRLQMRLCIASYSHGGSKGSGHCRTPYDKGEMAKHDTTMPQFSTLSTPKWTGAGFTKWTSRFCLLRCGRLSTGHRESGAECGDSPRGADL